jgi:hypothetical protein
MIQTEDFSKWSSATDSVIVEALKALIPVAPKEPNP